MIGASVAFTTCAMVENTDAPTVEMSRRIGTSIPGASGHLKCGRNGEIEQDETMDWLNVMARITYAEACRQNWPRPTCVSCHAPTRYDREFRALGYCQSCYREEPLIIQRKESLCPPH